MRTIIYGAGGIGGVVGGHLARSGQDAPLALADARERLRRRFDEVIPGPAGGPPA